MSPEERTAKPLSRPRIDAIRRGHERANYYHPVRRLLGHVDFMRAEIDRLNAELAEARLAAEEAWDAHDEKEHHERAA